MYWADESGYDFRMRYSGYNENGEPDYAYALAQKIREYNNSFGNGEPKVINMYAVWKGENPTLVIDANGGNFSGGGKTSEIQFKNFNENYRDFDSFRKYLETEVSSLFGNLYKEDYAPINLEYKSEYGSSYLFTQDYDKSDGSILGSLNNDEIYYRLMQGVDCRVYVVWKETKKIVFETNGGTKIPNYEVTNSMVNASELYNKENIPSKDGYVFAGWYRDKNLTNCLLENSRFDMNIDGRVVYAKWIEKNWDVNSSNIKTVIDSILPEEKFMQEYFGKRVVYDDMIDSFSFNINYKGIIGEKELNILKEAMSPNRDNDELDRFYYNLDLSEATGLTDLSDSAFENCYGLRSIKISQKISNIGYLNDYRGNDDGCFKDCRNLNSVTLPASIKVIGDNSFNGCTSLENINIPDGVTQIGSGAFSGCEKLKNVNLPESIVDIGSSAFSSCKELEKIKLPTYLNYISSSLFENCEKLTDVTLSNNVYSIRSSAFAGCSALKEIDLPDVIDTIGSYAFASCISMEYIDIPDSVTGIQEATFEGCTSLKSINIPDCVGSIGSKAFKNCEQLENLVLPNSLTSIGYETFFNCKNFTKVDLPLSVESIGYSAFNSCVNLVEINIPNGVKELSYHIFDGCTSLRDISLNEGLEKIGERAFVDCTSLEEIPLPSTIEEINSCAFYNCSKLGSITVPSAVAYIGDSAFFGCQGIKSITFEDYSNWRKKDSPNAYGDECDVSDPVNNVKIFTRSDYKKFWYNYSKIQSSF